MNNETKKVPNHPWLLVDRLGNCYSSRSGKPFSPQTDKDGYERVGTTYKNTKVKLYVHRAVALTYLENPHNKPQVNHLNSKRSDNRVENLEWCTPRENTAHGVSQGFIKGAPLGEGNGNSLHSEKFIREICKQLEGGKRNVEIKKSLGISPECKIVSEVRNKVVWSHISDTYNIPKRSRNSLSEGTLRWVCKCLSEGWSVKEVVEKSTNPLITKSKVRHIKNRNSSIEISKEYIW